MEIIFRVGKINFICKLRSFVGRFRGQRGHGPSFIQEILNCWHNCYQNARNLREPWFLNFPLGWHANGEKVHLTRDCSHPVSEVPASGCTPVCPLILLALIRLTMVDSLHKPLNYKQCKLLAWISLIYKPHWLWVCWWYSWLCWRIAGYWESLNSSHQLVI